jgi:signal transduction histidine kinase
VLAAARAVRPHPNEASLPIPLKAPPDERGSRPWLLTMRGRVAAAGRAWLSILRSLPGNSRDEGLRRQQRQLSEACLMLRHEVRSPLSSILVSAEILARPELCTERGLQNRQLAIIRSAVAHIDALLHDADAPGAAPGTRPAPPMVLLQDVVLAVLEELESPARAAGVTLRFQQCPPLRVEGVVLRLVLTNLVGNAIKYADTAKSDRCVRVRVVGGDGPVSPLVVEVADNGLGIPEHLQQRVFLRNFRAHRQTAEGSGLGLAITRERLMDRGGTIDLVSEVGVGTTVRFTLGVGAIAGADAVIGPASGW